MIIAIDYDNTYTAAPELWNEMIKLFQSSGHTIICVTARPEIMGQSVLDSIGKLVPVVFAGAEWKREAAEKRGYKVNVWIDDSPEYIAPQHLISGK
jgi:hydroxymethylpyrimidine pyrophosphatase-like HAD family hydrolase